MGVGIKRARAKSYIEEMDKVRIQEINQSLLGAKDVETSLRLDCECTDDVSQLSEGQVVRLLDLKTEHVEVFVGACQIGVVFDEGTTLLREKYGIELRQGRSFPARIVEIVQFTGAFTVELGGQ